MQSLFRVQASSPRQYGTSRRSNLIRHICDKSRCSDHTITCRPLSNVRKHVKIGMSYHDYTNSPNKQLSGRGRERLHPTERRTGPRSAAAPGSAMHRRPDRATDAAPTATTRTSGRPAPRPNDPLTCRGKRPADFKLHDEPAPVRCSGWLAVRRFAVYFL
jgi:hypothetical protein